jgi:hypothetical protein
MGQTIGKAARGGVQDGFARLAYQVGISGVVTLAPSAAAPKHRPSVTARAKSEFVLKDIGEPQVFRDADDTSALHSRDPATGECWREYAGVARGG